MNLSYVPGPVLAPLFYLISTTPSSRNFHSSHFRRRKQTWAVNKVPTVTELVSGGVKVHLPCNFRPIVRVTVCTPRNAYHWFTSHNLIHMFRDLAPPLALSRAGIFPSPSENSTAQGRSICIIVNMYVCQGSSRDQVLGWGLGSRGETTETAPALVELTFSWGDRPQGSKCLRHRWPLVTDSREEINMIMS